MRYSIADLLPERQVMGYYCSRFNQRFLWDTFSADDGGVERCWTHLSRHLLLGMSFERSRRGSMAIAALDQPDANQACSWFSQSWSTTLWGQTQAWQVIKSAMPLRAPATDSTSPRPEHSIVRLHLPHHMDTHTSPALDATTRPHTRPTPEAPARGGVPSRWGSHVSFALLAVLVQKRYRASFVDHLEGI